ncbi:hypothetical protein Ahy_B05g074905 [Arachis hypogaea]|uniref:DNA mismatch repair protein MutS-like N-terminal domain-containing protein n=1 Tax=Arachis hypogaea TaxID=3818 RepID=A0A444Z012_ARAHY|nr:hypothetical protein Ahy_B05g074905 [Arachis hypogaea]
MACKDLQEIRCPLVKELTVNVGLGGDTHSAFVPSKEKVGISESGIDDAVQNFIARGYKVGRVEQLETSEEAKARGANSVIQRKLVQVITPSTTVEGNIGPDANHLLAIKEGSTILDDGSVVYGFAFVDCARLRFWVGSIDGLSKGAQKKNSHYMVRCDLLLLVWGYIHGILYGCFFGLGATHLLQQYLKLISHGIIDTDN